jgi:Fic family protein
MVYTEKLQRGKKEYFYRVQSLRKGEKVGKKRIYLGVNLNQKTLLLKEKEADYELNPLNFLLRREEEKKLEELKKEFQEETLSNEENRYESFVSSFTYDSNAIEGNTLSLQETAQLLFEGRAPAKSLREINEIRNHKEAFDFVLSYEKDISRTFILELHKKVMKETLREELKEQIGTYRKVQVFIRGASWTPPRAEEVPKDMRKLLYWYTQHKETLHPLLLATYFHCAFELIHPFIDGNGRVGRLLMNFTLHKQGYPMINIPQERRFEYYEALEKGQVKGNLRPLLKFLYDVLMKQKLKY